MAAHEFFHAWNVKRIRPQVARAGRLLEGAIHARSVVRRGRHQHLRRLRARAHRICGPKSQFYDDLATQISELESRPAHKWQSVEESSLDAWLEKYDDYNVPERSISYYNKGQIVGCFSIFLSATRPTTTSLSTMFCEP